MELTENDRQFLVNALHTAAATYADLSAATPHLKDQFFCQHRDALVMADRFEQAEKIKIWD